jgi:hypothetical protein
MRISLKSLEHEVRQGVKRSIYDIRIRARESD